ncbi:hypothetical protein [Ensifer aridi]|uniref:hypothetical protein n=1 Tax=Ensifer aridi TaxID=1708715 RepID=UPI0035901B12
MVGIGRIAGQGKTCDILLKPYHLHSPAGTGPGHVVPQHVVKRVVGGVHGIGESRSGDTQKQDNDNAKPSKPVDGGDGFGRLEHREASLDGDCANPPGGTREIDLALELRFVILWVDDEERPLVSDVHITPVLLEFQDDAVVGKVGGGISVA